MRPGTMLRVSSSRLVSSHCRGFAAGRRVRCHSSRRECENQNLTRANPRNPCNPRILSRHAQRNVTAKIGCFRGPAAPQAVSRISRKLPGPDNGIARIGLQSRKRLDVNHDPFALEAARPGARELAVQDDDVQERVAERAKLLRVFVATNRAAITVTGDVLVVDRQQERGRLSSPSRHARRRHPVLRPPLSSDIFSGYGLRILQPGFRAGYRRFPVFGFNSTRRM